MNWGCKVLDCSACTRIKCLEWFPAAIRNRVLKASSILLYHDRYFIKSEIHTCSISIFALEDYVSDLAVGGSGACAKEYLVKKMKQANQCP
jgi:hypothetical protein